MSRRRAGRSRAARGQALTEFALALPIFLALIISVFDFGRIIWARNSLENAAREAARYAIVHGGTELSTCPVGPDALGRTNVCAGGSPGTNAAKDVAREFAIAPGDNLTVSICYGTGCTGDSSGSATNAPGTPVTVRTASTISLIVPQLFRIINVNIGTLSLGSEITMIVNT